MVQPLRNGPSLMVGEDEYVLDLSGQKGLQGEEAWGKLKSKTLVVIGTLTLPRYAPGKNADRFATTVHVLTLGVVGE